MSETAFNVGDTVTVIPYTVQTMSGLTVESFMSGKTGIILALTKDYEWRTTPNKARIRVVEGDNENAWVTAEPLSNLRLVQQGPGHVALGVTHPWTKKELREQRWNDFVGRALGVNLEHEGFSNPATFLAWMYLDQEATAIRTLKGFVRKDGSINPNRVKKLFSELRLKVDDWAYACPLEVPAEFAHRPNPLARWQALNWQEVSARFATQFAERAK